MMPNKYIFVIYFLLVLTFSSMAQSSSSKAMEYWRNAIVYFVIIDRFVDADVSNNFSYGRKYDGKNNIGTFHGGDLVGLTRRIKQGYFTDLGVDALWITAPFEQIHGWIPGGNNEFKHYAYHGYYTLDYTRIDSNFGTEADFKELIEEAHRKNIRVVLDVVINHPGYNDIKTFLDLNIDVAKAESRNPSLQSYHSTIDYESPRWQDWWGSDWIRAGLPGHSLPGDTRETESLFFLPDFKTESEAPVYIPHFLENKLDSKAYSIDGYRVRDYLISWICQWVRDYGVDGFRVDAAKHLDSATLRQLSLQASEAYEFWKSNQEYIPFPDAEFWLVGEDFGHKFEDSNYFEYGFDAMLNFDFYGAKPNSLEISKIYKRYSQQLNQNSHLNFLSFISSHDTGLFDHDMNEDMAKYFFFLPGAIQIFYGDETGRKPTMHNITDKFQNYRSDMNWDNLDVERLKLWQYLGKLRSQYPQIGNGEHIQLSLDPFVFIREFKGSKVLVVLDVEKEFTMSVKDFPVIDDDWFDAVTNDEVILNNKSLHIMKEDGIQVLYTRKK